MAQMHAESDCMSPRERVSATAGRYLLELYFASSEESERVPTGELSEHLDVHPASVTEMVASLEEAGFVDHRSHKGVEFTATGQTLAERLVWRFCVTDRFFTDMLDTHVERETAYQIGYALPPDGIATLGVLVAVPCQRACSHLDEEMGRTDVVSHA